MKLKRVAIVLSIIFLSRLIVSCCKCPDTKEMKYHYGEITVSNLDNSGEHAFITDADDVLKDAFGLQIKLGIESGERYYAPRDLGFSNANAMSCDCIYDEYLPTESIVSISIITIHDFDSENTAGADVTSRFMVEKQNEYISIPNYVSNTVDFYFDVLPESSIIRLFLIKPPLSGGEFSFDVIIELSNGDVISTQSRPVNLI